MPNHPFRPLIQSKLLQSAEVSDRPDHPEGISIESLWRDHPNEFFFNVLFGSRIGIESIPMQAISHRVNGEIPFLEVLSDGRPIHRAEIEGISSHENSVNALFLMLSHGEEVPLELTGELVNNTHVPLVKDEIVIPSTPAEGQIPNGTSNQVELYPFPLHDGGELVEYSISMDSLDDFLMHRACRGEKGGIL